MNKHFNKNLVMSEEKNFYFIKVTVVAFVKNLLTWRNHEEKVKDHCHVTGCSSWGLEHLQLTQKTRVIFHNLRGNYSHLIFYELDKFKMG